MRTHAWRGLTFSVRTDDSKVSASALLAFWLQAENLELQVELTEGKLKHAGSQGFNTHGQGGGK